MRSIRFRRADANTALLILIGGAVLWSVLTAVTKKEDRSGHLVEEWSKKGMQELLNEQDRGPKEALSGHEEHDHHLDDEAQRLKEEIRILCYIILTPQNLANKAKHIKATWGNRCTKLIFMSSQKNDTLGSIDLGVDRTGSNFWGRTRDAMKYIYDNHLEDYDWVFKADDDTYAILENMRYLLSTYRPTDLIYFGAKYKSQFAPGYMTTGPGYVMSKEAVKKFVEVALPDEKICSSQKAGSDEVEIGKCFHNINVIAGDSRDSMGRERFMPFAPGTHLMDTLPDWYKDTPFYHPAPGLSGLSDTPISFHLITVNKMYELEYLLYHARPYGIHHDDPFPDLLPPDLSCVPQDIVEMRKAL